MPVDCFLQSKLSAMKFLQDKMFSMIALAFLFIFIKTSVAGNVYTVGDNKGWTILGNVDYSSWASSKKFHVGDTLVFVYNKQFHNVMQVKREDYRSCNAATPLATYTTGNDTIEIKRKGHYFFICGVPTHCTIGQKVDIRIPKKHLPASPALPESPPPSGPPAVKSFPPPNPSTSMAASGVKLDTVFLLAVPCLVLSFVLA